MIYLIKIRRKTMKAKKNVLLGLLSICIFVLSLTFAIVDWAVPLKIWTHPILNFLLGLAVGFGIMALALAFKNRSPWYFFLSVTLFGTAALYVTLQYIVWWLCLIIIVVLIAVTAITSVMVAGNKTEEIALNKSPDYKTFEERKAEEKEKAASEEKAEKPLPQIKSFKD